MKCSMVFCATGITCWAMLEFELREKEKDKEKEEEEEDEEEEWVKSHEKAEASNKITTSRRRE